MDNKTVSSALEEVQKAYKIVSDFSTVLQDILRGFFKEFDGFNYYYRSFSSIPKSSPLEFSAERAIPTNNFSILYTRTKQDKSYLCLDKGDALVSCQAVISETLCSFVEEAANGKPFLYAAVMAAIDDVPTEMREDENSNNWYDKIWNTTEYSDHGTTMKHLQKPWVKVYTEVILLESMFDAASIKAVAGGFKKRASNELGITL